MANYQELMDAARKAHAAGRSDHAGRLVQMARNLEQQAAPPRQEEQGLLSGAVDAFTDGATFGFGDNITAFEAGLLGRTPDGDWFNYDKSFGERYDDALAAERGQNAQFFEDSPVTAHTANIAGAIAVPFAAAKGGATLLKGGMSASKAAGLGAVEGAGYGAAHGAGAADGKDVGKKALIGAAIGGGVGGSLSGLGQALANRAANKGRQAFNSIEELEAAKDAAYQNVDKIGARYTPEAVDDLLTGIRSGAQAAKINPLRHPKASSMLDDLDTIQGKPQSLTDLDQMRQVIRRDVARAPDEAEAFFGNKMIRGIDEFVETAGNAQLAGGNASKAATAIKEARKLHGRSARYNAVSQAVEAAKLRASSTNSGNNTSNAVAQNIRRELERSLKGKAYYSPSEQGIMREVVEGTMGQNIARGTAKTFGGALSTLGAVGLKSPELLISKGVGKGAQIVDEGIRSANVDRLLQHILQGGPKAQGPQSARANALQKLLISQLAGRREDGR